MTTEPDNSPEAEEPRPGTGTTQVGQMIAGLERLTRRLPTTRPRRPRRPRPYRSNRPPPPREHLAALIAALGDAGHPLHAGAVDELVEIGPPAVPLLCEALDPNQPWLSAYRAADAVGRIGDGRAAGPLLQALRHPNSNVRWSAVRALTQVGDMRAVIELRRVAQGDQGRTSWGEPVAGAAQSALDQLSQRSVWGQSLELIKTAITSVLMILALTLAFSVVSTLRGELDSFGLVIPGQTRIPQFTLPTAAPTPPRAAPLLAPTAPLQATPVITATSTITGTVIQIGNVRPLPGTNNEPIGRVNQGDEVIFLAQSPNGQWFLVRLGAQRADSTAINNPDGSETGWISQAVVTQPTEDLPVQEVEQATPTP